MPVLPADITSVNDDGKYTVGTFSYIEQLTDDRSSAVDTDVICNGKEHANRTDQSALLVNGKLVVEADVLNCVSKESNSDAVVTADNAKESNYNAAARRLLFKKSLSVPNSPVSQLFPDDVTVDLVDSSRASGDNEVTSENKDILNVDDVSQVFKLYLDMIDSQISQYPANETVEVEVFNDVLMAFY